MGHALLDVASEETKSPVVEDQHVALVEVALGAEDSEQSPYVLSCCHVRGRTQVPHSSDVEASFRDAAVHVDTLDDDTDWLAGRNVLQVEVVHRVAMAGFRLAALAGLRSVEALAILCTGRGREPAAETERPLAAG